MPQRPALRQQHHTIVFSAVDQTAAALQYAAPHLLRDHSLLRRLAEVNGMILQYAPGRAFRGICMVQPGCRNASSEQLAFLWLSPDLDLCNRSPKKPGAIVGCTWQPSERHGQRTRIILSPQDVERHKCTTKRCLPASFVVVRPARPHSSSQRTSEIGRCCWCWHPRNWVPFKMYSEGLHKT